MTEIFFVKFNRYRYSIHGKNNLELISTTTKGIFSSEEKAEEYIREIIKSSKNDWEKVSRCHWTHSLFDLGYVHEYMINSAPFLG